MITYALFFTLGILAILWTNPKNNKGILLNSIFIPLIGLIIYTLRIYYKESVFKAGEALGLSFIPAIISGFFIYFGLIKKSNKLPRKYYPIFLIVIACLAWGMVIFKSDLYTSLLDGKFSSIPPIFKIDYHKAFGASVKEKYPQYNELSDSVITNKVLNKYPVYQNWINRHFISLVDDDPLEISEILEERPLYEFYNNLLSSGIVTTHEIGEWNWFKSEFQKSSIRRVMKFYDNLINLSLFSIDDLGTKEEFLINLNNLMPIAFKKNVDDINSEIKKEKLFKESPDKGKWFNNSLTDGDSPYDSYFGEGFFNFYSNNSITYNNTDKSDVIVCLVEQISEKTIRNEYIRAGHSFEMKNIPDGIFYSKVFYGNSWNPNKVPLDGKINGGFEEDMSLQVFNNNKDLMVLKQYEDFNGTHYSTYEITLYPVANGNMVGKKIEVNDFFTK